MLLKTIICFSSFFMLTAAIRSQDVSVNEIINAERIYDLHFTDAKRDSMVKQQNADIHIAQQFINWNILSDIAMRQFKQRSPKSFSR